MAVDDGVGGIAENRWGTGKDRSGGWCWQWLGRALYVVWFGFVWFGIYMYISPAGSSTVRISVQFQVVQFGVGVLVLTCSADGRCKRNQTYMFGAHIRVYGLVRLYGHALYCGLGLIARERFRLLSFFFVIVHNLYTHIYVFFGRTRCFYCNIHTVERTMKKKKCHFIILFWFCAVHTHFASAI